MIQFRIGKIDVPQFAVIREDVALDDLEFEIGGEFSVNSSASVIKNRVKVQAFVKEDLVLQLVVDCYYDINPDSLLELRKNGRIKFPLAFMRHLATITIGAARGVLFSMSDNTKFRAVVMPLVDVDEIITKDLIVD